MKQVIISGVLLAFGLTGCGTVGNFAPKSESPPTELGFPYSPCPTPHHFDVYGGVRDDIASLQWAWNGPGTMPLICAFLIPDVPFSFIGDT
jgi:hypothetical protein